MTPKEKLAAIRMEFITLKARLPEPYRSNAETCIKYTHDLDDHLSMIDDDDDETVQPG